MQSGAGIMSALGAGSLALLILVGVSFLIAMALWFAPGLVVFRNVAPVDALKASFAACMKNFVPFLVFGVLYVIAATVASIPFGLGWILLVPLLMLAIYVSYRDVFGE